MQAAAAPAPAAPAAYQQPPAAYGQPPAAYGQPPAPAYGQPPVPTYGQPPAPAYGQPPAPAYGQPPASYGQLPASTPQYTPPAATPSPPVPPTSQYTPPVTNQYPPPPTTYTAPASHQTYSHPGVQPEQAQPPAFEPPVPNNYVPPGNGPQGTYPGVHGNQAPPPLPPASGRPLPPPRSVSAASANPANPAPPEPPARAPLPDPSSFPKPPPMYGYRATDQAPPAPPSRGNAVSTSVSTYNPPPPPGLPGLPPRAVPAVPAASPALVSTPTPVAAPAPVPAASPVSALPARTPPVVAPKPHKKAPPPPVKPKNLGSHQAPAAEYPSSPPPPYAHKPVAASHNPMFEQQQASASAIAAQLNQVNLNATDSSRSIEKSSTGGGSIRDKIKALNTSQPNFASQIAGRFNHAEPQHQEEHQNLDVAPKPFKKAAPPPPAKKKPAVPPPVASRSIPASIPASTAAAAPAAEASNGTPPPINFSNRPKGYELSAPPPVESTPAPVAAAAPEPPKPGQKEFDLQLQTLWFAQPTIQLPPTLAGLNYTYSTVTSSAECALTLAVRISEDLSIVKYRISWPGNVSGPALAAAVKQERKELPPPPTLTQSQLIQAYEQFGNGVAKFGESVIGQQVGDGECWTLAKEAIDQSSHGYAMSPAGYTHGALVYHAVGGATAPLAYNDSIRRGDILQFTSGKFETRDPATGAIRATSQVGSPNHTSIVTNVSANNRIVDIVHQNVGGSRKVQPGQHNLDEFVAGQVKIFRPVWKEWAGELDTTF